MLSVKDKQGKTWYNSLNFENYRDDRLATGQAAWPLVRFSALSYPPEVRRTRYKEKKMNQKQKKLIWFLIIAALIVGGYCLLFTNKQIEKKEEPKQETISKGDLIAKELADKYQAITGWEKNLTYTLQAQERLVTDKPVLFRGYIDDVFNRDSKTFVRFSSSFLCPVNYVLELECNRQVLDKVLSKQQNKENDLLKKFFDEYVVVARIEEVSKPVFALKGSVLSEDEVEIKIESSMLFTAKGTCVDIVYIGD
jgi:hypothetical protein